jgi:hypothetical protein
MQPCNSIYYSNVHWRLNMFQAAHRLSSGALNCILQPLVYVHMWWQSVVKSKWKNVPTQSWQQPVTTCACKSEAAKYCLELLMMSGVLLETCWAFNKRWNNKFYYKVASSCSFILIFSYHVFHKFLWYGLCHTTRLLTWTNPFRHLLNSLIYVYIILWSLRTPVIVHFRYLFTAHLNIVIYSKKSLSMDKINYNFLNRSYTF